MSINYSNTLPQSDSRGLGWLLDRRHIWEAYWRFLKEGSWWKCRLGWGWLACIVVQGCLPQLILQHSCIRGPCALFVFRFLQGRFVRTIAVRLSSVMLFYFLRAAKGRQVFKHYVMLLLPMWRDLWAQPRLLRVQLCLIGQSAKRSGHHCTIGRDLVGCVVWVCMLPSQRCMLRRSCIAFVI